MDNGHLCFVCPLQEKNSGLPVSLLICSFVETVIIIMYLSISYC